MPLKRRWIGLAAAALWFIAIGTIFTIVSLVMIGTSVTRFALAVVTIAAVVYLAIGVGVLRGVLRSHGVMTPRAAEREVMVRRFKWVVIGEVIAIMVVNGVCAVTQHLELIVPLDLLVVGIHFLPLASIFRVPRYHWTGWLFCAVSVLTLVLVPAKVQVGAAAGWFVLPTFGCTLVAWATAAFNLREVWQSMHEQETIGHE